jgi:hypothetical protein
MPPERISIPQTPCGVGMYRLPSSTTNHLCCFVGERRFAGGIIGIEVFRAGPVADEQASHCCTTGSFPNPSGRPIPLIMAFTSSSVMVVPFESLLKALIRFNVVDDFFFAFLPSAQNSGSSLMVFVF